jgi:hypothetical protein
LEQLLLQPEVDLQQLYDALQPPTSGAKTFEEAFHAAVESILVRNLSGEQQLNASGRR